MAMTAERGIHKPQQLEWALSIGATTGSLYLDGQPAPVGDGTWILAYREHGGAQGHGSESRWNRALLKNVRDRIPVGVFVPTTGRANLNLGLAMPESFDPATGTFLLRGPMRFAQADALWEIPAPSTEDISAEWIAEEDADFLVAALVRQRRAQGAFRESLLDAYSRRCCFTHYEAEAALQGAHILAYSGRSSQVATNGLLLRADVHILFDRHLLSVEPTSMQVRVSPTILRTRYAELEGRPVAEPVSDDLRPDPARLRVHWAVFEGSVARIA
ncbi:MAG: HNH endonuclease signature motif containing protein [Coriobacteriia bacterium]|nr:HNH endonuclease signature motif containing protein [Coriobacteriia bacterium]